MRVKRGNMVVVNFILAQPAAGTRPAHVVQNDRDNARTQSSSSDEETVGRMTFGIRTILWIVLLFAMLSAVQRVIKPIPMIYWSFAVTTVFAVVGQSVRGGNCLIAGIVGGTIGAGIG